MYRVMLADDEKAVLESVKRIIDDHFPGQCEIETAKSGRDVIELAEQFRPDIAVLDIQMPGINGIEAIREIKQNDPSVEFVILSAYDKFDYAKEALNLGVLEYVSKPVSSAEITRTLQKAMDTISLRRQKRSEYLQIKEKMENVMPIIENDFVHSLMFRDFTAEDLENYKNLLGLDAEYGCMIALVFGGAKNLKDVVGGDELTQRQYLRVRELTKETFSCVIGPVMSNKIPVFLPLEKNRIEYQERVGMIDVGRGLVRRLRQAAGMPFRIGIGSVRGFHECMESYEDALKALVSSSASVAHADDLPIQCRYDEEYPIDLERELFDRLKNGSREDCERVAARYFDWMLDNYEETDMSVRLKTLEFVLFAEAEAYFSGGMTYHFSEREYYLPMIMNAGSNSELKSWFVTKFGEACRNMHSRREEHEKQLAVRAKEYIQENFSRDLSLDEVSRHFDLSPYYFSKLFKKETGINFVEYVTELRISKAKGMLAKSGCSIKEICAAVGYSDPNYFSRIFKKSTGVTPTEYKEIARG